MKPDVICTWPSHMDYPHFRWNISRFRDFFDRVIIVRIQHEGHDVLSEVANYIPKATVVRSQPVSGEDWRSTAVNEGLGKSRAPYVLFIEQDFLIKDFNFMDNVFAMDKPFIYFKEAERIHPAFSIMSRSLIEKTSKDFSARPPEYDHFGLFFNEAWSITPFADRINIGSMSVVYEGDFYHLAGLTHNYHLHTLRQNFYKPEEFLRYNSLSLRCDVPQSTAFRSLCVDIEEKYGSGKSNVVDKFF